MERWIAGRLRGGLACALLFTLAALPVRGQDPVAMVENPAGSAMVKPATGEPAKALHHGDTLVGKDRIQLASGGRVTLISVASLEKKDLSGGVDSAVDALLGGGAPVAAAAPSAPKLSSLVAVLSAPQLEPEGIKRVQMPRTVRGRRRGFVDLIYPRNTRIREDRPTFRWKPVTGADGYEITILTGTMEPVVDRESVKTNEFTYPPGIPPLAPGRPYFWQIRARGAGRRPGALVYFERVAPEEASRVDKEIEAVRGAIRSGGASAGTEALLVGSRLNQAGLTGEALNAMRAGLAKDPDHSALAKAIAVLNTRTGRILAPGEGD